MLFGSQDLVWQERFRGRVERGKELDRDKQCKPEKKREGENVAFSSYFCGEPNGHTMCVCVSEVPKS